jgi:hypothetical protein
MEAVAEFTLRLPAEAAITRPPAVAEVTLHLPEVAAVILPPAVVVVIAIRRHVAVLGAAAAEATAQAAAPTEAEDTKLTYKQGQAAGTSTQPAAAPAFLFATPLD